MQNNFLEYLQKNGVEAFDKMAADLAKQLNDAKAQYEADQKKKAEDEKKAKKEAESREAVEKQIARLLKFYYGEDLPFDALEAAKGTLNAVDKTIAENQKKKDVESKMKVVRDEDVPGGHIKVMQGDLRDLTDEELLDFWNGMELLEWDPRQIF